MNVCFSLTACVQIRCTVDTHGCHVNVLLGNLDTSLLLFIMGHADKLINSDGNFNTFEMPR